jgi:hypothetical protein
MEGKLANVRRRGDNNVLAVVVDDNTDVSWCGWRRGHVWREHASSPQIWPLLVDN